MPHPPIRNNSLRRYRPPVSVLNQLRDLYSRRLPRKYDLVIAMIIVSAGLFLMVLAWQPPPEHPARRPSVNVPGVDSGSPRSDRPYPIDTFTTGCP